MDFSALITAIANAFSGPLLTALANALSIAGFVITIFVFLDVRKIKKFYVFTGRVIDLSKSLKQHSSNISEYLNDFEGFLPQIQEELTRAEVTLKSLEKKTSGQLKQSVANLARTVQSYDAQKKDKDGLRTIYLGMIKIQAEIADLRKDQQWEMPS
jgi:hypothetical protein